MDGNETNPKPNPYIIPASIVVAGVLIAVAVAYSATKNSNPRPTTTATVGNSAPAELVGKENPFLGNPDAPITVVEFSDFQCPFCKRFFDQTEKSLVEKYVKTGKVKFVYRNFAFLGPESKDAAEAALCANEQGKFWEYHDYLFTHQNGENQGGFSTDNLKNFAREMGLNTDQFNSCTDSHKHADQVTKDSATGRQLGVTATPTVFVNSRPIVGALPTSEYEAAIEEALARPTK